MWNDFYWNLESKEIILYILLESLTPESLYFAVSVKFLPLTYVHHCIYGGGQLGRERYCTFEFRFVGHKISGKIVSETLEKKNYVFIFVEWLNTCSFTKVANREYMGRVKRIWYLSPMRAAKVQASLRIRAVSPEPPLLVRTSSESGGTFRQKTRSLAPLNCWACAVKVCHDGMSKTQIRLTRHIFNSHASKPYPYMCQISLLQHVPIVHFHGLHC